MYPDYLILLVNKSSYTSFYLDKLIYSYYLDKVFKLNIFILSNQTDQNFYNFHQAFSQTKMLGIYDKGFLYQNFHPVPIGPCPIGNIMLWLTHMDHLYSLNQL